MTHIDRGDLIALLDSGIGTDTAERAIDETAAARQWTAPGLLETRHALALLAQCASRPDAVGVAAGLAHRRLALRIAREEGVCAQSAPVRAASRGGQLDDA